MLYSFTIDQKPGFLHVKVKGENSPATVAKYLAEVHQACAKLDCSSVLVEENLEGPSLNIADVFRVVSAGSENVHPVVQRIAYVDVNRDHDAGLMRFAETVAINRGVNIRLFTEVADAENWLRSEIDHKQRVDK